MAPSASDSATSASLWKQAREGDFRGTIQAADKALAQLQRNAPVDERVDLHLVSAFCMMRQGHHADALHALDAAARAAAARSGADLALRVEAWRAELAYFQGRYSAASEIIERVLRPLEQGRDWAYVAFALRIRIALLLAHADYDGVSALSDRAIAAAESSGDDYVLVQILNILGAVQFDRATSKLPGPHARSHLTSIDPAEAAPMESDAREALRYFERAREVADRGRHQFAAWYVAGNIERLEILLGRGERAVRSIRKRLRTLQERGAKYDEIVARSNLAWGLRTLGHHREALYELDAALAIARETGTFNVLLEFLHYDRSVVLGALGDAAEARASYRRYLRLVEAWNRSSPSPRNDASAAPRKVPLEPFFLKRADRFIAAHLGQAFSMKQLAIECGVSWRTLQKAFGEYRGITPVAHVRNVRLDQAHHVLEGGDAGVGEVASRFGFRSPTTFALEYRKRFGTTPSHKKRSGRD